MPQIDYKEFFTDPKARKIFEAAINNPDKELHELIEIAGITEEDVADIIPLLSEEDQKAFAEALIIVRQKQNLLPNFGHRFGKVIY